LSLDRLSRQLKILENKREALADFNIDFIRKKDRKGYVYFIANLNSGKDISRFIPLAAETSDYVFYDPMTCKKGRAKIKKEGENVLLWLQLKQGQSIFLFATDSRDDVADWKYSGNKKQIFSVTGDWKIEFLTGGPFLPASVELDKLISWTDLPDSTASYFSGLACYTVDFNMVDFNKENKYILVFDKVKESVLIRLNGKNVGTLFSHPFEADISGYLRIGMNHLELETANLMANRIRYLDKKRINWKKFYDINFVNIKYKKFDASKWRPVESGIIGNVSIVSYKIDKEHSAAN